jgi:GT2 family glycosyltransferase
VSPTASVVIVTYNGARFVRRLLDSVRAQSEKGFEVIVVDNASTDGTADIVEADYPEVRLLRQRENLHFARGNNLGYREAQAPIVVLLNQDTWVEHDWLHRLLAPLWADTEGKIACTHSPILNEGDAYEHSTARFRAEGAKLATLSVAGRNCATGLPLDPTRVFYGSGAALAVRKSYAGDELFPADFGAYAEDVALGFRLRIAGGGVLLVPEAHVHHALPPEGRPSTPAMLRQWERNRLAALYLHYTPRTRWLLKPVLAADLLALALGKPQPVAPDGTPRRGAPTPVAAPAAPPRELRRAVVQAVFDSLAQSPKLAAQHKEIEKLRRVPEADVTRAMTARVTPFDGGLLGKLNCFSIGWCKAFGIVTVETAERGDG